MDNKRVLFFIDITKNDHENDIFDQNLSNYMKLKFFNTLCLLLALVMVQAQDRFHRTYPNNDDDVSVEIIDGLEMSEGAYAMLGVIKSIADDEYTGILLSTVGQKGDETWSRYIELPESTEYLPFGSLTFTNSSLFYSLSVQASGSYQQFIGSYDMVGMEEDQYLYSIGDMSVPMIAGNAVYDNDLTFLKDSTIINYRTFQTNDTTALLLGGLNIMNQEYQWVDGLIAKDTFGTLFQLAAVKASLVETDSSLLLGGLLTTGGSFRSFITKTDSLGNVIWSRSYGNETAGNEEGFFIFDQVETPDSHIYMCGLHLEGDSRGFVSALDSVGNVLWSNDIDFGDTLVTFADNIAVTESGIVVAGKARSTNNMDVFDFHLLLDMNGNEITNATYGISPSVFSNKGNLISAGLGGTMYFTTNQHEGVNVPALIKADEMLLTICSDTIGIQSLFPVTINADTLVWESIPVEINEAEIVAIEDTLRVSYDIPTLTLGDTVFCPDDPIDYTFDANTEGAVAYIWSTGATSDTLRVMEEGEFMVTVTVGEKVCYMLCDTGQVSVYEEPEITVTLDDGPFCETGQLAIGMNYIKEAPIDKIEWSTGDEDVNVILIPETGNYGVTVTDICMETASQDISVNEFPELISSIEVSVDEDYCANDGIRLTAIVDAAANSAFWSNGDAGTSIVVQEAGSYSVTVTDICNNPWMASVDVGDDLIVEAISELSIVPVNGDCVLEGSSLELQATFIGEASSFNWSNGSNTQTTTVTTPGVYNVTVANECDDEVSASLTVEECPECIRFAKLFFPRSSDIEENRSFGAELQCPPESIADYNLKIYNKWGNLVFETDQVMERWNGTDGGDASPSGVYVYYATYNAGAGEQSKKGDVTLIR